MTAPVAAAQTYLPPVLLALQTVTGDFIDNQG